MLGSFKVIGNKRVFIELQLPKSKKIYNVFHLNLFRKVSTDLFANWVNHPSAPVIINNEKKREVEDIPNAKNYPGKLQY